MTVFLQIVCTSAALGEGSKADQVTRQGSGLRAQGSGQSTEARNGIFGGKVDMAVNSRSKANDAGGRPIRRRMDDRCREGHWGPQWVYNCWKGAERADQWASAATMLDVGQRTVENGVCGAAQMPEQTGASK
jgi:hypothetical protein